MFPKPEPVIPSMGKSHTDSKEDEVCGEESTGAYHPTRSVPRIRKMAREHGKAPANTQANAADDEAFAEHVPTQSLGDLALRTRAGQRKRISTSPTRAFKPMLSYSNPGF